LTACSAPTPPGLFHPGSAHGVQPSRAFSSRGAAAPSGARCPPDVRAADPTRAIRPASSRAEPWPVRTGTPKNRTEAGTRRLQGFAPLGSSLPSGGGLDRRRPDALLGFCLSRDLALAPGPVVTPSNSPALRTRTLQATEAVCSSRTRRSEAYRRASCAALSRDRPPLLRSPTFSRHSAVREQPRPEVIGSLRAPSHVAALRRARFGPLRRAGRSRNGRIFIPALY